LPDDRARPSLTQLGRQDESFLGIGSLPSIRGPAKSKSTGSQWQFEENIILEDPERGDLVLDILKGQRVGGVEFLAER
jgi:hypothetical protein